MPDLWDSLFDDSPEKTSWGSNCHPGYVGRFPQGCDHNHELIVRACAELGEEVGVTVETPGRWCWKMPPSVKLREEVERGLVESFSIKEAWVCYWAENHQVELDGKDIVIIFGVYSEEGEDTPSKPFVCFCSHAGVLQDTMYCD